jgi:hypothetical protein
MTNHHAATLIAERLPHGLPHPGDPQANQKPFTIPLPGLRPTGIPPDMAAHFANQAGLPSADVPKLIGQAIVNLLETDGGYTILANTELAQLRQDAADAPDGTRIITLRCTCHNRDIFQLTIGKSDHVRIDPKQLARALEQHQAA